MVSEPSEETRELLERLVRRLGHDVVDPAADPAEASVDVILHEPGRPGGRAAPDPRGLRPDCTLVVSTIYPASETSQALEPAAFLLKPFSLDELARALDTALAARDTVAA